MQLRAFSFTVKVLSSGPGTACAEGQDLALGRAIEVRYSDEEPPHREGCSVICDYRRSKGKLHHELCAGSAVTRPRVRARGAPERIWGAATLRVARA